MATNYETITPNDAFLKFRSAEKFPGKLLNFFTGLKVTPEQVEILRGVDTQGITKEAIIERLSGEVSAPVQLLSTTADKSVPQEEKTSFSAYAAREQNVSLKRDHRRKEKLLREIKKGNYAYAVNYYLGQAELYYEFMSTKTNIQIMPDVTPEQQQAEDQRVFEANLREAAVFAQAMSTKT